MSKNQPGPRVGPRGRSDFRIFCPSLKLKTVVFAFSFPPRMGPMGIMRIMGVIFPLPRFLVLSLHPTVGVTGLEPVTLRLSSACSNQLSYTPVGWPWVLVRHPAAPPPPGQWRHGDSNPRPIACKATALPTELCPLGVRDSASPGLSPCGGIFLGS